MAIASTVIVLDPADPADLVAAARQVVGDPPVWHLHECGDMHMIQAEGGQGARAQAAVHFPARGGAYREGDNPAGYAMVTFTSTGFADLRVLHTGLLDELGALLTAHGLRWAWRYEDDPWQAGK